MAARLVLILLALLVSGCATTGYRGAVSGFAGSTKSVAEALQMQMSEADIQARQEAIFEGYGDFEDLSSLKAPKSAAFRARGRMTDEQRAVRSAALSALTRYGSLLEQLAQAETTEEIETAAREVGLAGDQLAQTIADARGTENPFGGVMGPLAALGSAALDAVLEVAIRGAMDKAILGGEDAIKAYGEALERDLRALHADRKAWLGRRRGLLMTALKQTVVAARTDPTALVDVLVLTERVVEADDALRLWSALSPETIATSMVSAHQRLLEYARAGHKKELLTEASHEVIAFGEAVWAFHLALEATSSTGLAPSESP